MRSRARVLWLIATAVLNGVLLIGCVDTADPTGGATATVEGAATSAREVALPPELSHIMFSGGSGVGCANAVKIENAMDSAQGRQAERLWLEARYPGAERLEQAVTAQDERTFDVYSIRTVTEGLVQVCFDISAFF